LYHIIGCVSSKKSPCTKGGARAITQGGVILY